jgi:hypothetical protein
MIEYSITQETQLACKIRNTVYRVIILAVRIEI